MCCSWNPNSWEVVRHPGRANGSACPGSSLPTASFHWDLSASGSTGTCLPLGLHLRFLFVWLLLGFFCGCCFFNRTSGNTCTNLTAGHFTLCSQNRELNLAICVPCESSCGLQFGAAGQGRYLFSLQRYRKGGVFVPRAEVQQKEGILRALLLQFSCWKAQVCLRQFSHSSLPENRKNILVFRQQKA